VIAVLAVLASLLVPALSGAVSAGRSARCLSNLREMTLAARAYALEYSYFPPAIRYEPGGVIVAWDWVTTAGGEVLSPGALWDFTDDPGAVHQCPVYSGSTSFADPYTGYNYNTTHVGGESEFPSMGWDGFRPGVRYGMCIRPAQTAVFGDGAVAGGEANKFMRAPMNTVEEDLAKVYSGAQAFRHGHATNVGYLDGHVTPWRAPFRGALATEPLLAEMGYPENGFLSDDDSAYDPR
jgi:prepilin-type processing-associated H-X9-DG protein